MSMSMSILGNMSYVNVRHQLPRVAERQQQAMTTEAGFSPAELHTTNDEPVADMAATLVKVDINTYPCRKQYGFLNNADFGAQRAQEGLTSIKQTTSAHTQAAWDNAKNAAKPGVDTNAQREKSKLAGEHNVWPTWTVKVMPPPEFTVTPSEIVGQMDTGDFHTDINATADANIHINTGSAETYMKDKGFIRMWVTKGYIDTQA